MISASVLQNAQPDSPSKPRPSDDQGSPKALSPSSAAGSASTSDHQLSYAQVVSAPTSPDRAARTPSSGARPIPPSPGTPLHITFATRPLSIDSIGRGKARQNQKGQPRESRSGSDPERLPLLNPEPAVSDDARPRGYKVIAVAAGILVLVAVFALGGWMIGRGEGGSRWPG